MNMFRSFRNSVGKAHTFLIYHRANTSIACRSNKYFGFGIGCIQVKNLSKQCILLPWGKIAHRRLCNFLDLAGKYSNDSDLFYRHYTSQRGYNINLMCRSDILPQYYRYCNVQYYYTQYIFWVSYRSSYSLGIRHKSYHLCIQDIQVGILCM